MVTIDEVKPIKPSELVDSDRNDWCPGCGDNGIRTSVARSLAELTVDPEYKKTIAYFNGNGEFTNLIVLGAEEGLAEDIALNAGVERKDVHKGLKTKDVMMVTGIGCSAKITNQFQNIYTFHSLHGRALAVAQAIKLANWDLEVIVSVGDGDGLGIGGNHFFHAGRKNIDMTVLIHDNQVYGLTKGQMSPTMLKDMKTKSMAAPAIKEGINPLASAIASRFSFVAQSYSNAPKHLVDMLKRGVAHKGTALINVLQTCPTYNDIFTDTFFKMRLHDLSELDPDYDPIVRNLDEKKEKLTKAFAIAHEGYMRRNPEDGEREAFKGLYYQDLTTVPLEYLWAQMIGPVPLAKRDITSPDRKTIVKGLMSRYKKI